MELSQHHILYLYRKVLFPHCAISTGARQRFVHTLGEGDRLLVYPVKGIFDVLRMPGFVTTLAEVVKAEKQGKYTSLQLKGISRVHVEKRRLITTGYYYELEEKAVPQNEGMFEVLRKKAQELIFLINVNESDKLIHLLNFISDLHQLTDFVANYFVMNYEKRYALLNELNAITRAKSLLTTLDELIDEVQRRHYKEKV